MTIYLTSNMYVNALQFSTYTIFEHLAAKIPVWAGSDCIGFMQLNLKLRWVLRVAKNFMGGSEGTIYSRYFECISFMFPITFPVTFHFRLPNPDTSVSSQSVPQSDRSKISYFPTFVGRVQS